MTVVIVEQPTPGLLKYIIQNTASCTLHTTAISPLVDCPNDWDQFVVKDLAADPRDQHRFENFKVAQLSSLNQSSVQCSTKRERGLLPSDGTHTNIWRDRFKNKCRYQSSLHWYRYVRNRHCLWCFVILGASYWDAFALLVLMTWPFSQFLHLFLEIIFDF